MATSGVVTSGRGGETSAVSTTAARRITRRCARGLDVEGLNRGMIRLLLSRKKEVVSN
jgi:hypothetical protein